MIYLVFTEGYTSTEGETLLKPNLCDEAIRLARLVSDLLPEVEAAPEAAGLLALMLFHDSRRATRLDASGAMVQLEEQDRARWEQTRIDEATALLDSALASRSPGPYQIQAAIAALHARPASAAETDWPQIAALYRALLRHWPTPVVELNAAVALAMAGEMATALAWMDRLDAGGELTAYPLLHAARADLLRRLDRIAESRVAYGKAIAGTRNQAERAYLEQRRSALADS